MKSILKMSAGERKAVDTLYLLLRDNPMLVCPPLSNQELKDISIYTISTMNRWLPRKLIAEWGKGEEVK